MSLNTTNFAYLLKDELISNDDVWQVSPNSSDTVTTYNSHQTLISLNLSPITLTRKADGVEKYFDAVITVTDLKAAYDAIQTDTIFENNLADASLRESDYATKFRHAIFDNAIDSISKNDVALIIDLVKSLDRYTAVKTIESLLYSRADLVLLQIAKLNKWSVHFDHVAIRCGNTKNNSAQKIAELLIKQHGYSHPQIQTEKYYLFEDGWSAYPLYKMLDNGQVLRLFVDQSEQTHPLQVIQHWNDIYGYTAHHLALRLTKIENNNRIAIPLEDVIKEMQDHGREILNPAGYYTRGLLSQVFTRPEKNLNIPNDIRNEKNKLSKKLTAMLVNAKLLEIVSRKEMSTEMAEKYFNLYDIDFKLDSPLHSAVYYQYFLPAQAAHVINTSIQI